MSDVLRRVALIPADTIFIKLYSTDMIHKCCLRVPYVKGELVTVGKGLVLPGPNYPSTRVPECIMHSYPIYQAWLLALSKFIMKQCDRLPWNALWLFVFPTYFLSFFLPFSISLLEREQGLGNRDRGPQEDSGDTYMIGLEFLYSKL